MNQERNKMEKTIEQIKKECIVENLVKELKVDIIADALLEKLDIGNI